MGSVLIKLDERGYMKKILLSLAVSVFCVFGMPATAVFANGVDGGTSEEDFSSPTAEDYREVEEEAVNEGNEFFSECLAAGYSSSDCYQKQIEYTGAVKEHLAREHRYNREVAANGYSSVTRTPLPTRSAYMPVQAQSYPDSNGNPGGCNHDGCC